MARTSLALPVDPFIDFFDSTVSQTQLSNNTVLGSSDDRDILLSQISGAEDEFRNATNLGLRVGRAGVPGDVATYKRVTYDVKGHEAFKRNWARTARDYRPTEVETNLPNKRILPIDSSEGDEVRIYRGMDSDTDEAWDDVTSDQGDLWDIIDHRDGTLVIHPVEIHKAMNRSQTGVGLGSQLRQVQLKLTYRFGGLGGDRGVFGETSRSGSGEVIDSSATPDSLSVADAGDLVDGSDVTLKVESEYLRADIDTDNDTIDVKERGIRNTTAAAHDAGVDVVFTAPAIRKAVGGRAAAAVIETQRYEQFLPESDPDIDKSELLDRIESTWSDTVDAMRD